ncbi:MAG: M23 family metallopeptidase [Hyphomonadaceae bacterium]|jgi:hypothetical protein|nr:M23 family metallopeptidase [Hyphomonadaceae bacterium]
MRIAKVGLAFFSIGFLAGSFERAAGLGHADQSRGAQDRRLEAAIMRSAAYAIPSRDRFGDGLPEDLLSRPIGLRGGVPDGMTAALYRLETEPEAPRERVRLALYGPPASVEEGLTTVAPIAPDFRPRFLRIKHIMSAPDRVRRLSSRGTQSRASLPKVPRDAARALEPAERANRGPEFIMPFERGRVTSLFHQGRYHPAIDLAGPLGSRVQATTRRQKVTFAGWRNGYGNTVVTRDDTGRMHLYAHLQRIVAKIGTVLDQGQMLGTLGSTGYSTGPHVHYEVKTRAGAHVDPVTLLFGRRVGRGYAWNGSRSVTRVAARTDGQPRPR